ncbi:lipid-A-disaccharide synthase [Pasteurellaceae bacterium HPA106]|uniref:lipid-A-disaccharide synthase n=1 Tax=Spirabiliibacterium pneumoniae TaxID=221400 RepID=UPI001AAD68DC|nr:lipid-A-disaccharide synthase [Spirabiliibacterium pneumoniae]MBE2896715.1 lipid-A-disaccharide synthase [Spirabiliibacterium pneumoniae]
MTTQQPCIAIVAGEVSGDILGAGLITALKQHYPNARFIGIAGARMQQAGMSSLFDMEELAVMGLVEVVKHLPRLLKRRKELIAYLLAQKPDVFIGIDAPDFNLTVERVLKEQGIKTLHYVSPSVWAWRQNRIHTIAKATHLVLAFLPFEKAFYDRFNVPCRFVGHTLADAIPLDVDRTLVAQKLHLDPNQRYIAMLPGSRGAEVAALTPTFLQAAQWLKQHFRDIQFLVPLVNAQRRAQFDELKASIAPDLPLIILDGHAREAMQLASATMLASGTAALECMLCNSPMVVCYKMKPLTYFLAKRLVKTPYISLPNLLANAPLVPELIQHECTSERICEEISHILGNPEQTEQLKVRFKQLHQQIRCNADAQAAQAVVEVLNGQL